MSYLDDEMERVMRDHEKQMKDLGVMQSEIAKLTVEMTSANGAVSATVDSRGGLTALRLHGDRHRQLPGTELSAQIMAVVAAARAKAEEKVLALMPESTMPGLDMAEMMKPDFDWSSMLPTMFGGLDPAKKAARPTPRTDGKVAVNDDLDEL